MSDDDETLVRRRLARVTSARGAAGSSAGPAGGIDDADDADRSWDATLTPPARRPGKGTPPPVARDTLWPGQPVVRPATPDSAPRAVPDPPEPDPPVEPSGPPVSALRRLTGQGAFDPGRGGVRALAAVAVVVVLAAGFWAWSSRPRAEPVPVASAAPAAEPSGATGPRVDPSPAEVVVAVAGRVHRPGLVRLPSGARVADALAAAGGALPGVDVALLNPARRVTDGELILVGVSAPPGVPVQPGAGAAAGAGPAGAGTAAGGKVNLNTATLAELDGLPGVGPVLAQRILDHRAKLGGFRSVGDLRQVDGIGDSRYEELKDLVTV